jgi:hypothetical protein
MQNTIWRRAIVLLIMVFVAGARTAAAQCSPETYGANRFDGEPDDAAIQACLDQGGTVVLQSGADGAYLIRNTVYLTQHNTVLTSSGPGKAYVLAHTALYGRILEAGWVWNYEISGIEFNGNKYLRDHQNNCFGEYRWFGTNLLLQGYNFWVHDINSVRAMCGSAMEVVGSGYEIYNNYVSLNGRAEGEGVPGAPWSDGITLLWCDWGYVHDNQLENNTDVDLIVGGGQNCRVQYNTILHVPTCGPCNAQHGFAGLMVGWFQEGGGDHTGSVFSNNTVISNLDMLAFGIMVGHHPWISSLTISQAGVVQSNGSSGSVVALAIDGIAAGNVSGNSPSGAQGSWGFGCPYAANYTAFDFGAASIDGGYYPRWYHNGSCNP